MIKTVELTKGQLQSRPVDATELAMVCSEAKRIVETALLSHESIKEIRATEELQREMSRMCHMPVRLCSIEGCSRPHVARDYCMRHYALLHRRGSSLENEMTYVDGRYTDSLTEDEFCTMKDKRSSGFSVRDVAIEMRIHVTKIKGGWEFETYAQYLQGVGRTTKACAEVDCERKAQRGGLLCVPHWNEMQIFNDDGDKE